MRGLLGTISDAVRSIVDPAALVQAQQPEQPAVVETPAPAADPVDLYTDDEMPSVEAIERAALQLDLASDNARRADRAKRAAKKVLTRLPADGIYGTWRVYRKPSARTTPDLEAIAKIFKANNLGPIPTRTVADSLVVERVAVPAQLVEAAA
jgi:hypothetical protein